MISLYEKMTLLKPRYRDIVYGINKNESWRMVETMADILMDIHWTITAYSNNHVYNIPKSLHFGDFTSDELCVMIDKLSEVMIEP